VFGRGELEAPVVSALRDNAWHIVQADSMEKAASLCNKSDVLTGLALFPQPLTDDEFQRMSHVVISLRHLQWLVVLARESLVRSDVKRLIVERLRNYQLCPIDINRLTMALGHVWGIAALAEAERRAQRKESDGRFGMVGNSPPMVRLYNQIERIANTELPVLITGESGTGKELVARAIHAQSLRASGPFVGVNCAAIPESLMQSELFGAAKGAFTDATSDNKGLIRTAERGTLLLDEIGEMPLQSQASLLRFLEDKIVTPVGHRGGIEVDVRVIASINRELQQEVRAGQFRLDLLHRLNVLTIETTPLRDRPSDIEALARHFLRSEINDQSALQPARGFSDDAVEWLPVQPWNGNVRELRSYVIRAALHCRGDQITANDLNGLEQGSEQPTRSLDKIISHAEKATLEQALAHNAGNVSKTARDLEVSRMTLYRLMAKHGIERS